MYTKSDLWRQHRDAAREATMVRYDVQQTCPDLGEQLKGAIERMVAAYRDLDALLTTGDER